VYRRVEEQERERAAHVTARALAHCRTQPSRILACPHAPSLLLPYDSGRTPSTIVNPYCLLYIIATPWGSVGKPSRSSWNLRGVYNGLRMQFVIPSGELTTSLTLSSYKLSAQSVLARSLTVTLLSHVGLITTLGLSAAVFDGVTIADVQGTAWLSPYNGRHVRNLTGVVTGKVPCHVLQLGASRLIIEVHRFREGYSSRTQLNPYPTYPLAYTYMIHPSCARSM
jgi:hypothetical protein